MREILKYTLVLKYGRNIVILEKGVFGKRVLLIERGTFICLESFFIMKGTLNRELLDFSKRVHLIEGYS